MIGEENEKDYKFFKIIILLVQSFVIGLCFIFFIGVSRVDAAGQNRINQNQTWGSWTNNEIGVVNQYQNIYISSTTSSKIQLKDTTAFISNRYYDLEYEIKIQVAKTTDNDVINIGVTNEIYNGTTLVSASSQCNTSITSQVFDAYKRFTIVGKCVAMSGANYYPYISIQLYSSYANRYRTMNVNILKWNYSLNQNATDSNAIINNNNNNTTTIINNNNENTENIINNQNENTEIISGDLNDINDTLTDSSIDNPNNALNGMNNYFGSNGVISDLLLLPVRMFQSIVNTIDGTCSDFSLGTLLGHELTMPCINLSSRLGSALYGVIDVLISGFFILSIRKKFVDIFEHFTSLKTGGNELE